MLDAMMKIGGTRVDYFGHREAVNPEAFGFYIRGDQKQDAYSRDAKHQLYAGLNMIHVCKQMANLKGIYIDVNSLQNTERPAYVCLKQDLYNKLFHKVIITDMRALFGHPAADMDVGELQKKITGLVILFCEGGEFHTLDKWVLEEGKYE